MGNGPPVAHDAPSIAEPSKLSVVAGPLEDFIGDVDLFWNGVIQALREPRQGRIMRWQSLGKELREHDAGDGFTVIIQWNGLRKHLDRKVPDYSDRFVNHIDHANKSIIQEIWSDLDRDDVIKKRKEEGKEIFEDDGGRILTRTLHVRFHDAPLRVEMWEESDAGETRKSGKDLAAVMTMWVSRSALENRRKVSVLYDVVSEAHGGACVVTDPIDEYFTYDDFFSQLSDILRDKLPQFVSQVKGSTTVTTRISDEETEIKTVFKVPSIPGLEGHPWEGSEQAFTTLLKTSQDEGDISFVLSINGELFQTQCIRVDQDPLRVVSWGIMADGTRIASRDMSLELTMILEYMLFFKRSVAIF